MKRTVFASTFAFTLIVGLLSAQTRLSRTPEEVAAKSSGCVTCHKQTDEPSMHATGTVQLGCADCHGGDAAAQTKDRAHPRPRLTTWPASANPVRAYTDWLRE